MDDSAGSRPPATRDATVTARRLSAGWSKWASQRGTISTTQHPQRIGAPATAAAGAAAVDLVICDDGGTRGRHAGPRGRAAKLPLTTRGAGGIRRPLRCAVRCCCCCCPLQVPVRQRSVTIALGRGEANPPLNCPSTRSLAGWHGGGRCYDVLSLALSHKTVAGMTAPRLSKAASGNFSFTALVYISVDFTSIHDTTSIQHLQRYIGYTLVLNGRRVTRLRFIIALSGT